MLDRAYERKWLAVAEKMAVAGYVELRRKLLALERSGRLYHWLVDAQAMKPVSFLLNKYCRQVAEQGNLTLLRQWADFWSNRPLTLVLLARADTVLIAPQPMKQALRRPVPARAPAPPGCAARAGAGP